MKHRPNLEFLQPRVGRGHEPWGMILLVATALLAAGCAAPGPNSPPPRPGAGLREYQHLLRDLRKAVTASRQSVEKWSAATPENQPAAGARFDERLQRLEVVSLKARARAEAIEKRGAAYFAEWAEEISGAANDPSRRAAEERFAELRRHYDGILEGSQQVRQAFRRFLEGARRLRASLLPGPAPAAMEQARPELTKVAADGLMAEEAIRRLLNQLVAAEAAVVAGSLPPAKLKGKP